MLLRCPYCQRRGEHVRSDFLGDWVVCPACQFPFSWRETLAESEREGVAARRASGEAIESKFEA